MEYRISVAARLDKNFASAHVILPGLKYGGECRTGCVLRRRLATSGQLRSNLSCALRICCTIRLPTAQGSHGLVRRPGRAKPIIHGHWMGGDLELPLDGW